MNPRLAPDLFEWLDWSWSTSTMNCSTDWRFCVESDKSGWWSTFGSTWRSGEFDRDGIERSRSWYSSYGAGMAECSIDWVINWSIVWLSDSRPTPLDRRLDVFEERWRILVSSLAYHSIVQTMCFDLRFEWAFECQFVQINDRSNERFNEDQSISMINQWVWSIQYDQYKVWSINAMI